MGCQGEIYVVLGKRLLAERVNPAPALNNRPQELLYKVNNKVISLSEDRPMAEFDFLDGFTGVRIPPDLTKSQLGVKILGVDHEMGDRNFGRPIEAIIGYALANESYAAHATALPPMGKIADLRPQLKGEIEAKFNLRIPLEELELHLLYERT